MAWMPIAGSAVGALVSSALTPSPTSAAAAADPFAGQRGQYQTQLNQMMQPGSSFNPSDPSYSFSFNQGLTAMNRANAASGMGASGNALAGATAYGQNQAQTGYANQFSRLSQLAGAGAGSPAAAGQIIAGNNALQQQGATAFGSAVGTGVQNWFSQPATTPAAQAQPTSNPYQTGASAPSIMNTSGNGATLGGVPLYQ